MEAVTEIESEVQLNRDADYVVRDDSYHCRWHCLAHASQDAACYALDPVDSTIDAHEAEELPCSDCHDFYVSVKACYEVA